MIIRKGTHSPFRLPRLLVEPKLLTYNIIFTPSCAYDIGQADQADVNKLFGIGYFPHHHKNSVRFGWRYDVHYPGKMEILSYWYDDRKRFTNSMGYINIGQKYTYEMWIVTGNDHGQHHLVVKGDNGQSLHAHVMLNHKCDIGYLLRPYFGGNQTAPHDMEIIMKKA